MFIITATDDYGVDTRFVVGCAGPALLTIQALEESGYTIRTAEGEIPLRSKEEAERAQTIIDTIMRDRA